MDELPPVSWTSKLKSGEWEAVQIRGTRPGAGFRLEEMECAYPVDDELDADDEDQEAHNSCDRADAGSSELVDPGCSVAQKHRDGLLQVPARARRQRQVGLVDAQARRGLARDVHLHHHAPVTLSDSPHNPGSQHSGHRSLCRAPERTHAERQQPGGSPPSRRADHTDHNDQATQSSR